MKKLFAMLLMLALCVGLVPSMGLEAKAAESYAYPTSQPTATWTGGGTTDNPYLINTAQQLADMAWMVNNNVSPYKSAYYKLSNDLDLSGGAWAPIGCVNNLFSGTFDGNHYTISGLNNVTPVSGSYYAGLFGTVNGGTVKNLTVSGSYTTNVRYASGICAYLGSGGTIDNCTNKVSVNCTSSSESHVGGIVGTTSGINTISNCVNEGKIQYTGTNTTNSVGGISGWLTYGLIEDCINRGDITGKSSRGNGGTGGICGKVNSSENNTSINDCTNYGVITGVKNVAGIVGEGRTPITNCGNEGKVTGSGERVGGIVGYKHLTVTECYNTADIKGLHSVGGIAGYSNSGDTIKCFNTGNVTGTASKKSEMNYTSWIAIGGIEGNSYGQSSKGINIENCYNTGSVTCTNKNKFWGVGGITGLLYYPGTVENCHSTGTVSGGISGYMAAIVGRSNHSDGKVENCYFLNGSDSKANKKTAEEFTNGAVTALLNSSTNPVWVQGEQYPVFGTPVTAFTVTLPIGTGYTAAAAEGSSSPVNEGGSYSFTVTINDGYRKGSVFAVKANDTQLTEQDGKYTITNINANQTVTVEGVEEIPSYTVSIDSGIQNGTVTADKATAAAGEEVTLTITPDEGYELASLIVDGNTVTVTNNEYTFNMPDHNVTVSATFKQSAPPHTHSYRYSADNNVITETCDGCLHTETATITISEDADLYFTGNPITPAIVTYSNGWQGDELAVEYSNNVYRGSAKATIAKNDATAEKQFQISYYTPEATMSCVRNEAGWAQSATLTAPDNHTVSLTSAGEFSASVSLPDANSNRTIEYYIRTSEGKTYKLYESYEMVDSIAPGVRNTAVTNVTQTSATVTITANNIQQGSITPSDVVNYTLYLDDTSAMTSDTGVFEIFGLTANQTYTFAYSIMDAAGNVYNSTLDNAIQFTTITAVTITGVTVTPTTAAIIQGNTQLFTATVNGTGSFNNAVSWTVSGNNSSATSISEAGLLTVGADETATELRVIATSVADTSMSATASVTVEKAPVAPTISTSSLAEGTVGVVYSQAVLAAGDAPITWTVANGSLPAGLTLNSDGMISGTPTTAGTFTFIVKAENTVGSNTQELTMKINPAPVVTYTVNVTNGTGSGDYAEGAAVTITAGPAPAGQRFKAWTGAEDLNFISGSATTATATFTMPDHTVTVTATYEAIPQYAIMVSASTGGQLSTSAIRAAEGDSVTVTAVPSDGYMLKSLTIAGEDVTARVDSDGKYTFPMPASNVEIVVVFDEIPETTYTVTVTAEGSGTAAASPTSGVAGTEVTLSATPESGYQFKEWQVVSGNVTVENNKFTIGTENVEIRAIFVAIPQITDPARDTTITVIEGEKATLTIAAQNAAKYQWYIDFNDGAGWKPCGDGTATYVSAPTKLSNNGYRYYCEVTSATGETAKSPIFTLVVVAPVALPETGDHTQLGAWLAMLALCGAGMLALSSRKRRTE